MDIKKLIQEEVKKQVRRKSIVEEGRKKRVPDRKGDIVEESHKSKKNVIEESLNYLEGLVEESRGISKEEFIKAVNKLRTSNKNDWYYFSDVVEGKKVELKGYGTWIQIAYVDGRKTSGGMDIKVSEFKKFLEELI